LLDDRVILLLDLVDVDRRRGEFHAQGLQGLGDDPGDGKIAEPLVVRGDDEPGGVLGAAFVQCVLEGLGVGVPERALGVVPLADLPVPGGVLDTDLEAFELFGGVDVEIELQDMGAVVVQQLLEIVDVLVAPGPDGLRHHVVHPLHQHVFVVGTVEDAHLSLARRVLVIAPQEVVSRLRFGGDLEAGDVAALGVHGAEHMVNSAVLTRPRRAPAGR